MKNLTFLNSNAVAKPERRNKKQEIQTLCMLGLVGLVGLALFMLSGCRPDLSGNPTPITTLEKSGGGGGHRHRHFFPKWLLALDCQTNQVYIPKA